MNVYTEFGNLTEVIVGVELGFSKRVLDFTFKNMYRDNMNLTNIYDDSFGEYKVSTKLIEERNADLDSLSELLTSLGVKVRRPLTLESPQMFRTPDWGSVVSSASNVRDIVLTYGNSIVETPLLVRNRVYENQALQHIFYNKFNEGANWVKAPTTSLAEKSLDLEYWKDFRDFSKVPHNYEMGIDAAHCIKIGKDVIVNVANYNHYLGYKWLKRQFPETTFHRVKIADSHIDGTLMPLRPGVFLANGLFIGELAHLLPKKFRNWEIIYTNDSHYEDDEAFWNEMSGGNRIKLASSRGMDTNVLSINEEKVLVLEKAVHTKRLLETKGFEVISFNLRHGEIFAGGIHCSTLDLEREDEFTTY
jgi:glycine amidinotransferase